MKKSFSLIVVLVFSIIITSCGGGGTPFENIVKSEEHIAFVGSVDAQQIIDKGDFWKHFGLIKMMTGKMLDSNEWGMNIFSRKNILIIADDKGEQEFAVVLFSISSQEKFEKRLGEFSMNEKEEHEGFFVVANEGTDDFSIAWNEKMGIAIGGIKEGVDVRTKLLTIINHIDDPADKELPEEIKEVVESTDDMRFVFYTNKLKNKYVTDYKNEEEIMKLLEGAYFVSSLNGENGSIQYKMEARGMDKFLNSKYNFISKNGISQEVLSEAISSEFLGLVSFSLEKSRLTNLIKDQMQGRVEEDTTTLKLTESISGILTGDVAIAFKDLSLEDDLKGVKVVIGIKDFAQTKVLLDSLPIFENVRDNVWKSSHRFLNSLEMADLSADIKNEIKQEAEKQDIYITLLGKNLIISDSIAFPVKPVTNSEHYQEALKKPFFLNIDLNSISTENEMSSEIAEFMEVIQVVKGGSDIRNTTITIQFKDKNSNGWKQLFKVLGSSLGMGMGGLDIF